MFLHGSCSDNAHRYEVSSRQHSGSYGEDAEKYGRTLIMQIIHRTDTWPPRTGDYKSCLVLYDDDNWNDYCYEKVKEL